MSPIHPRPVKISALIKELQELQAVHGDLPLCSEGNPPEQTDIRLTPLDADSVSTLFRPFESQMLYLQIY